MSSKFNIGSQLVISSTDPIILPKRSSDPLSGMIAGEFYYNTTDNSVKLYNGSSWNAVATGSISLVGQILNQYNAIVGNAGNLSVSVNTNSVGDILADSVTGFTVKDGAITNAKINASAAISRSKIATGTANHLVYNDALGDLADLSAITASRALVSDANGLPVASAVTATELGYVSGVTFSIQEQLDGKASLASLSGRADTSLSNLSSVAINTDLLPNIGHSVNIGSLTAPMSSSVNDSFIVSDGATGSVGRIKKDSTFGVLSVESDSATGMFVKSQGELDIFTYDMANGQDIVIMTNNTPGDILPNDVNSGELDLLTGNVYGTGSSGSIKIVTGTAVDAGARGNVFVEGQSVTLHGQGATSYSQMVLNESAITVNSQIKGIVNPTDAQDAVTKSYLDGVLSGAVWLNPIIDPDLIGDTLSAPPVSPVNGDTYIVGTSPTGVWAGLAGHALSYSLATTSWIDILGRAVQIGDRFGVSMESGTTASGGLLGKEDKIVQITDATVGAITYNFTSPISNQAVYVSNDLSSHFGHSYNYSGTHWVEFGGPGAINAGDGLEWSGNTLNVKNVTNSMISASAAIAYSKLNLGSSIVNADISSSAAIAYSKLNLASSIVNADVSASAAIAFGKMAALTSSRALVSDGSGIVSASAVTSAELGYVSGVTSAIQTQLNNKASTLLDNLGVTAINADLLPASTNSVFLGSSTKRFSVAYIDNDVKIGSPSLQLVLDKPVSATLAPNTSTFTTALSLFSASSQKSTKLEYEVTDGVEVRAGMIMIATNGTTVGFSDVYSETSPISSLEFQVALSSGNIIVQYKGTGANTCTLKAVQRSII